MKLMHLFESLKLVNEGYKEAIADFSKEADKQTVASVIDQYKELVKRNQVLGDERNIDYWRKHGWGKFNSFIQTKSNKASVTQIKRKKVAGNAITLQEDDDWLIVIPLDKDASCFHGKNSDWCTTKVNHNYFEEYFYDRGVILIYCISKKNSGMWAIAAHHGVASIELFDQQDNSLSKDEFKYQTGLDPKLLVEKALSAEHKPVIDTVRKNYKELVKQHDSLISKMEIGKRNTEIEELLIKTKVGESCGNYIAKVGVNAEFPLIIQMTAVKQNGNIIEFIENPSEAVQLAAVDKDTSALQFIKNPSEKVQLATIKWDARRIVYIENPSEEVQLVAVSQTGFSIKFIKNPSEKIKLRAVQNAGQAIQYIENPSEEIQLAAVQRNAGAFKFIKDPTPKVIAWVKNNQGR